MSKKIKITLIKSPIGHRSKVKKTLIALGLKRLHQTIKVEDSISIKGMIPTTLIASNIPAEVRTKTDNNNK